MKEGVIAYTNGKRFVDRIPKLAEKLKLFKVEGCWPIYIEATGERIGGFYHIKSIGFIVRLLNAITKFRGKDTYEVKLYTD